MDTAVIPAPLVDLATRTSRARIPLQLPRGVWGWLLAWYSRRTYGKLLEPVVAMAHSRPLLVAVASFERRLARWKALDPELKILAVMAAAAKIECSWCLDFGYFVAQAQGLELAKIAAIPRWRADASYSSRERDVLEYAELMTDTPPRVTDALATRLRQQLGSAGLAELTMMVAVENQRSRFNAALGLHSQGFAHACPTGATR